MSDSKYLQIWDFKGKQVTLREIFVSKLVKEILGPRNGIHEILDTNPLTEYITGILAPAVEDYTRHRDIESEAEIPMEETEEHEEGPVDVNVDVPPLFSPALDPQGKPPSMGLSFVVEASMTPQVKVCVTWAKYQLIAKSESVKWTRQPRYAVLSVSLDRKQTIYIDQFGKVTDRRSAEISLHVFVRQQGNHYFTTIFMVNVITPPNKGSPTAEHHIFQPQIRVKCDSGCRIVEGIRVTPKKEEEQKLEFLYSNRPVLAKGHLCSAVWRDIDPENQLSKEISLDFPQCRNELPFTWLDGELLPLDERNAFTPADVRTEFVPMYCIPSPRLDWSQEYGTAPELRAGVLAETWDSAQLRNTLSPLVFGYEQWIHKMEYELNQQPEQQRKIAESIIKDCQTVLKRIKSGIEVLCDDDDARLAFCFVNKAIDIQSRWSRKSDFRWHPFQLAFFLMVIESIINPDSPFRNVCDLLWVPTGAGKTEAYLAVAAFTMAYRRRIALKRDKDVDRTGAGVSVITRYTLRLLTIQQFRRILSIITACEFLRVKNLRGNGGTGWRPTGCRKTDNFLWGSTPFRVGLWVGGNVTPNTLSDYWAGTENICGALSILKGKAGRDEAEPAQVLRCPACDAILAIPEKGLQSGEHILHFVVRVSNSSNIPELSVCLRKYTEQNGTIAGIEIVQHQAQGYYTIILRTHPTEITSEIVDSLWEKIEEYLIKEGYNVELSAVRASRPGYFLRYYINEKGKRKDYDFEIFCPNPNCELHCPWQGGEPMGSVNGDWIDYAATPSNTSISELPDGNRFIQVQEAFMSGDPFTSDRIPIPALTVDDQLYHRLPAVIVATADKFARPPFEPRAASFFGNAEYHHSIWGYYRPYQLKHTDSEGHPMPVGRKNTRNYKKIPALSGPDLILQDELHLIEGPLGSLVGFYETALDFLCSEDGNHQVKYLASTATVRRAEEQVEAVFTRKLQVFPPPGFRANDRFFITESEVHPLDDSVAGRLYVGVLSPGRGAHTPMIRIWARLLQTAWELKDHETVDIFWTLTGYFNSIRELAGARALYRQDIPLRVEEIGGTDARNISDEKAVELSSRTRSTELPPILDILEKSFKQGAPDALFTTSMFGTGIDIRRVGLMVVDGQPKTTSTYIQSSGRVGRTKGGLVVTFYRASRPRDLSHYEFFCGYHRQLHRFVEPITVYPFSPGVIERAAGPVIVFILRNMKKSSVPWWKDDTAHLMADQRTVAQEVKYLPDCFVKRAENQPRARKPDRNKLKLSINSELDRWQNFAKISDNLKYVEYAIKTVPKNHVVLGDAQHQKAGLSVVYENTPQSLREIEETIGFET